MPNGGEDKHAKLRTAWNRLRRRHPTELEQFGPEPWDEETGKLTPEASAAYRKIAQPAPTPAAAPVTPTVTAPTAMPSPTPTPTGEPAPSPSFWQRIFAKPGEQASFFPDPEGLDRAPLERLFRAKKPWEARRVVETVPSWVGKESARGVANVWDMARGAPERIGVTEPTSAQKPEESFREFMERRIRESDVATEDLHPAVKFGAEVLPILLGDIALTKGRGFTGLVKGLQGPSMGLVRQPGVRGAARRFGAEALQPLVGQEEIAGAALRRAGRIAAPTVRTLTGLGKAPAALRQFDTAARKVPTTPAVPTPPAPAVPVTPAAPSPDLPIMGDLVTSFDEAVQIMVRPDMWRQFANLPVIRAVQGKLNPSAVANNPLNQAAAARARLRDDVSTLTQSATARLGRLGSQEQVFGKLDDSGLIAEGPLKRRAVNDIRTRPKDVEGLTTPEQKEWIRVADEIENAKLNYLEKNGIDIQKLTFDEGGQYAGRRVWGRTNALGEIEDINYVAAGPGRIGAKLPSEEQRMFKTAAEAIEKGYRYIPDDEALAINVRGAYNRVIDQRYANWLLDGKISWRRLGTPEGVKAARESARRRLALAKRSILALQRAIRGESLPTGTVNAIERLFPQLEGRLRGPTKVRVADVLKAAKTLEKPERVLEVPKPWAIRNARREVDKATERLALDPNNQALIAELKKKNQYWGFLKYQYKIFEETGKPLTLQHNVIKALREDALGDLREMLDAIRGTLVRRPGMTPRYEGGLIADVRKEVAQTLKRAKEAAAQAAKIRSDEAEVQAPAFAGKAFPKEIAESLRKTMDPEFSNALAQVNKVQGVSRFFMLGGDISPMMIQLFFLIGENPRTYAKAAMGFVEALRDPSFLSRYFDLPENKAILQKYPGLRLTGQGKTEFTEALARGGLLGPDIALRPRGEAALKTAALMVPRAYAKTVGPTVRPFARGFEGALDVAGIEMAKSLDHMGTTAAKRADLAQFINKFRGVSSSARLGVGTRTRQLETLSLLAPQYNRAIAALLFDVVHGGLSGELARRALARGVVAAAAMAVAISWARGESLEEIGEHLNPSESEFMTWKVGNQNIGPGTKVRSVIQLFARSAKDPGTLTEPLPEPLGKGTPWGDYEYMRNPIIRFGRGLASPGVGGAWDLLSGKNFIGDPSRDGMLQMSETVAERFMYLWAQTALFEGGTPIDRLSRATGEFAGLRAYPVSPLERREERGEVIREEAAEKLGVGGTYEDIINMRGYEAGEAWSAMELKQMPETSWQQDPKTRLLMGRDPEYAELSQRSREETRKWNPAKADHYEEIDLLWDNEDEKRPGVLQQLEAAWETSQSKDSEHPAEHYRLKRSEIFAFYYHDKDLARQRAEKRGAFPEDQESDGPFAVARDVYNRLLFADDNSEEYKTWVEGLLTEEPYVPIEDEYGFNWDERERRMEYLVRAYSQKFVDDSKALSEEKLPQIERTYRRDIESIKNTGYWDVDKFLAYQNGVSADLEEYRRLQRIDEPRAKAFLDANEVLRKEVINKIGDFKKMMRSKVEGLDAILVRYGYVSRPVTLGLWDRYSRGG